MPPPQPAGHYHKQKVGLFLEGILTIIRPFVGFRAITITAAADGSVFDQLPEGVRSRITVGTLSGLAEQLSSGLAGLQQGVQQARADSQALVQELRAEVGQEVDGAIEVEGDARLQAKVGRLEAEVAELKLQVSALTEAVEARAGNPR